MKKKNYWLILLVLICNKNFSQRKFDSEFRDDFSVEIDANYNYYMIKNLINGFNYGFSLHVAKYIHKVKLSVGINRSKKLLSFKQGKGWWSSTVGRVDYQLEYINIPIFVSIETVSKKRFASSILFGSIISHNTKYEITSYYINGKIINENVKAKGFNDSNLLLLIGNTFSIRLGNPKPLQDKFVLNLLPFISYKAYDPPYHPRYGYQNIPSDRIMFGFKVGIEYLIKFY